MLLQPDLLAALCLLFIYGDFPLTKLLDIHPKLGCILDKICIVACLHKKPVLEENAQSLLSRHSPNVLLSVLLQLTSCRATTQSSVQHLNLRRRQERV